MKQLLTETNNIEMQNINKDWKQTYIEMGSRDKNCGKMKYYKVISFNHKRFTCSCPAYQFSRGLDCKHIKNLKMKLFV